MREAVYQDPLERTLPALARRAAATWGEKPISTFTNGQVTYRELAERMIEFAGALQALGVQPQDRVAIVLSNRVEWMETWFGICALGAIEVPINFDLKGRLLAHCLSDSGAKFAIVEDRFLPEVLRIRRFVPQLTTLILVGSSEFAADDSLRILAFDSLRRPAPDLPEVRLGHPACIMYTSGTTGNAKGVVLPHNYFLHFGEVKARHMRTGEHDRIYNVYPMFNASGQCEAVTAAMAVGASAYTASRFSARRFWDDVRQHHCTEFIYMGGILSILAKASPSSRDKEHSIRAAYGVPTPPHLHRPFEERFGLRLVEPYGATEINIVTFNPYDERRIGSAGIPTCGFDVRVVDEDENDMPRGTPGEIIARPNIPFTAMTEYWKLPEKSAHAWRGGWWRSGDMGTLDEDGFLYFAGRKVEALRHRGYMINPTQIEAVIDEDDSVMECAVVGLPDPDLGEDVIKAFVVSRNKDIDLERLVEMCLRELPVWMVPRYWERRDSLPKTPTQKVAKTRLREEGLSNGTVDLIEKIRGPGADQAKT